MNGGTDTFDNIYKIRDNQNLNMTGEKCSTCDF